MVSVYSGLPSMRNHKLLRTVFFQDITQHTVGQPIGPETFANNYHHMLCNTPEEGATHILHGRSLKSVKAAEVAYDIILYDNS